jgi:hypothetical protein
MQPNRTCLGKRSKSAIALPVIVCADSLNAGTDRALVKAGTRESARSRRADFDTKRGSTMDLHIWIPVTVILGLMTMLAMFAFIWACEKV